MKSNELFVVCFTLIPESFLILLTKAMACECSGKWPRKAIKVFDM